MGEKNPMAIGTITCYDSNGEKLFETTDNVLSDITFTLPKTEYEIKRDYYYAKFVKYSAIRNRTKSKRIKKKNHKLACKYYRKYSHWKLWQFGAFKRELRGK